MNGELTTSSLIPSQPPLNDGRTVASDIIVGTLMMLLSSLCALAYGTILLTIWNDSNLIRMTSYRFMFALGIFDVIQCLPHFVTGLFTIFQTVWHPLLAKWMGVLATPSYVAYVVLTVTLSLNRFIQLSSPTLDRLLFTEKMTYGWFGLGIIFWLGYAIVLSSPWAAIVYIPDMYSWSYDYSLDYSHLVQKCEMVIEIGGIFISSGVYVCVVVLLYRTRKRFFKAGSYRTEIKILIQAAVITVYCTILNVFWHNYEALLPANIWSYMGLNFMWIFNSGIYPLIYFIVNKTFREQITSTKHAVTTVSAFTRSPLKTTVGPHYHFKTLKKQFDLGERTGKIVAAFPKVRNVT